VKQPDLFPAAQSSVPFTPITADELRALEAAAAGSLLVLDHERERVLDELARRRAELLEVPEAKEAAR